MGRWGDEKTLKFIFLYRNHECLWNVWSPLYKNKTSREKAYQSLLESLKDKSMNLKSLKTKIKNLRSIYHTELKKVKDSERGGFGAPYKPKLSWFEEMHSFLGDTAEYNRETIMYSTEIETLDSDEDIDECSILINEAQSTLDSEWDSQEHTKTTISSKRKHEDDSISEVLSHLENISKALITTQQTQTSHIIHDEFYYFGQSVAAQLRKLPLPIALKQQSEIQNALSASRLSSIKSNSDSPSYSYDSQVDD